MIWTSNSRQIYVLSQEGSWKVFDDGWTADQPEIDPSLSPPAERVQPQRGFGKVWREELDGSQASIGWAMTTERPVDGWQQQFEGGLLLWTDAFQPDAGFMGTAYLLFNDGGWLAVAAPAP